MLRADLLEARDQIALYEQQLESADEENARLIKENSNLRMEIDRFMQQQKAKESKIDNLQMKRRDTKLQIKTLETELNQSRDMFETSTRSALVKDQG